MSTCGVLFQFHFRRPPLPLKFFKDTEPLSPRPIKSVSHRSYPCSTTHMIRQRHAQSHINIGLCTPPTAASSTQLRSISRRFMLASLSALLLPPLHHACCLLRSCPSRPPSLTSLFQTPSNSSLVCSLFPGICGGARKNGS